VLPVSLNRPTRVWWRPAGALWRPGTRCLPSGRAPAGRVGGQAAAGV